MLSINKEYMVTKINSLYTKIMKVIPTENKLLKDLIIIANNYNNEVKTVEKYKDFNILFTKLTENFWKNLTNIVTYHIKSNNIIYGNWGYRVEEIIMNESW